MSQSRDNPSCVCASLPRDLEQGNRAPCLGTCRIPAFPWLSCSNRDFISLMGLSRFIGELNLAGLSVGFPGSRVGLAETAGKALICLAPLSQIVSHPCSSARRKTPPTFLILWEYLFWRDGSAQLGSTGVEEPTLGKFLLCSITSARLGKANPTFPLRCHLIFVVPLGSFQGLGRIYVS